MRAARFVARMSTARSTSGNSLITFPARMHEGSITIRISATVHEIERLNRLIRQFGELHDLPGRTLYAVNLALDEVVSNIVLYGYEASNDDPITIKMEVRGAELEATVEDSG